MSTLLAYGADRVTVFANGADRVTFFFLQMSTSDANGADRVKFYRKCRLHSPMAPIGLSADRLFCLFEMTGH